MRQKYKITSLSSLFTLKKSILLLIFLCSSTIACRDKTEIDALVFVRYQKYPDLPVPNAKISLFKEDLLIEGTTNTYGEFSHTFKLPAVLDIRVFLDTSAILKKDSVSGEGRIVLESGTESKAVVYVY